jgi:thiosulfate/3-mercaptopyruvate sulfurtransferase
MRVPTFVKGPRFLIILAMAAASVIASRQATVLARSDPWAAAQVITPATLAKKIGEPNKPLVVCVALKMLYDRAHVPGAVFLGPGQNPDGIADLKHWAESQPKDAPIVLYCGCCPWSDCPNIRPAFAALKEMGFTNLRVVEIPRDFSRDWRDKGYPVEPK